MEFRSTATLRHDGREQHEPHGDRGQSTNAEIKISLAGTRDTPSSAPLTPSPRSAANTLARVILNIAQRLGSPQPFITTHVRFHDRLRPSSVSSRPVFFSMIDTLPVDIAPSFSDTDIGIDSFNAHHHPHLHYLSYVAASPPRLLLPEQPVTDRPRVYRQESKSAEATRCPSTPISCTCPFSAPASMSSPGSVLTYGSQSRTVWRIATTLAGCPALRRLIAASNPVRTAPTTPTTTPSPNRTDNRPRHSRASVIGFFANVQRPVKTACECDISIREHVTRRCRRTNSP
ncbi:hypothetical protein NUW54_g2903 [Trametes sanguinea]|uniref:Uncharacterized protein n=1 Tax=Trametes sanguinea TaxID=158606 RepID=A0ACC1Q458_9APHY|nr:hypothetical protein NUW54_g2903 [Trametes sanguinea]